MPLHQPDHRRHAPSRPNRPLGLILLVLAIFCSAILLAGCSDFAATDGTTSEAPTVASPTTAPDSGQATKSSLPSWLKVYFTDPNPPDNLGHGIDQYVQPVIEGATTSIDVTSFDLNLPSLVTALADASKRGVKVRVVYDGTNGSLDLNNDATGNKKLDTVKTLKAAKIGLVDGGRSNGLMHDKMIIVDSKVLFMGSWNLAYNDTYRNNNNLLKITNAKLIANYQAKFNELFVDQLFGTHAVLTAPNPAFKSGSTQVENYFAPEEGVMDRLVEYVQGASQSVHFMIFTFTHEDLSAAMIARAKAGVEVQGVIENRGASQGALPALFCAKVPVKTDGNKYTMHHKVIILDGETVITGSFNFTKTADTANDDNLLVIHNAAVAALYEKEFQKLYAAGETPQKSDYPCK